MESKKLQQIKLANSHLAPQPMPQSYAAASYHPNSSGDYRSPHSPIFQNKPHPSNASNFAQIYLTEHQHDAGGSRQQSNLSHSSGSSQLNIKPLQSSNGLIIGYPQQQQPPPKPQSYYPFDSGTYQNNNRDQQRVYQQAPPTNRSGQQQPHPQNVYHNHPAVSALQQQYQQLQQAKIQQQMQTQNEAIVHSQRTFALRQQLNPPVPQSHFHIQSMSQTQLNQQQQAQSLRNIPPSTLNLTNQFQPATGPVKLQNDAQNIYGMNATNQIQSIDHLSSPNNPNLRAQNQQMLYQQNRKIQQQIIQNKLQVNTSSPSEQTPIIKQNHPGMVVNQASQTQLSDVALKTKSPSTENSSPMHQSLDRKKSFGTIQSLKSPVTKRPSTAPVTLSGWLFKQGSEGLKVWRKRWFVLSEYCLFYYKGSEEEKLLGSILLPSYCVAACSQDDKIYRKFAFKCEHQNMRTYWLAAETAESMGQWVRALTAATMMQGSSESSDQTSQPSVSSLNPSGENSDSGIHTYQSQQSKLGVLPSHGPVTPASDKQVSGVGGLQPLYANAPPKPRRANDGGYSSPSPENSIERYESGNDSRLYHHHHNIHQQPLDTQLFNQSRRSDVKSPMSSHMNDDTKNTHSIRTSDPMIANRLRQMKLNTSDSTANSAHSNFPYGTVDNSILQNTLYASDTYPGSSNNWENIIRAPQRFDDYHTKMYSELHDKDALYMQSAQSAAQAASSYQQYMSSMTQSANAERRTPDTYGRSRAADSLGRNFGDYEDIYNLEQQMNLQNESTAYQRPMSPNITGHFNQTNINAQLTSPISVQMRSRPIQSIPRPHSADFLEYEARHNMDSGIIAEPVRAPRPKSSLDINRTPDNFYYSEASYAEKMRQSALYLQKPSSTSSSAVKIKPDDSPRQAQSYTNTEYPSNTSSMPRESDLHHNNRLEMEALKYSAASSASVPRTQRPYSKTAAYQQQEQFLRSASARLPRKNDDVNSVRDGERKREESMKRLLEWKQRMLQSPLTRKGVPMSIVMNAANSSLSSTHNQHYGMGQGIQRSRSETNANAAAGYNSYSSDDEDEPQKSPAGRSTSPSIAQSPSNEDKAPNNNQSDNPKPNVKALCTTLLDKDSYVPVYTQKRLSTESILLNNDLNITAKKSGNTQLVDALNEIKDNTNNKFTQDDKLSKYETDMDSIVEESYVSCDEENDIDFKDGEYTDDDLEEALKSESENEITKNQEQSVSINSLSELSEGHYMPMTPKKSILSLSESNLFTCKLDNASSVDESPYVEMTKMGLTTSILADDYKSTYELVCVNNSAGSINHKRTESEPVYMELSQLKVNSPANKNIERVIQNGKSTIKKSSLKKCSTADSKKKPKKSTNNLPDILKPSQSVLLSNSDSSDADDESSKDQEIMEKRTLSRSRFSLSDTFRPASYYLGVTRKFTECPDSSDSEIVSPPPIPSSPPPIEEMKTEEIFSSENYNTVKRRSSSDKNALLNISYDQIPKIHSSSSSLNSIKKDGALKTSRLSLPDQFVKFKNTTKSKHDDTADTDYGFLSYKQQLPTPSRLHSDSSYSCYNTDNSSITSSDYDLYNKVKMQSPSFTSPPLKQLQSIDINQLTKSNDSEIESVELRSQQPQRQVPQQTLQQDYERQMKRRPLSEDSFSEIESSLNEQIDHTPGMTNNDLDQYLNKLQSNEYLYTNTNREELQRNWSTAVDHPSKLTDIPLIKPPEVFCNENDANYYGNINFMQNENLLLDYHDQQSQRKTLDIENKFHLGELVTSNTIFSGNYPNRCDSSLSNTNGTYYDSLEDKQAIGQMVIPSHSPKLSSLKEKNISVHDAQYQSEDLKTASYNLDIPLSNVDHRQSSIHSRQNSNLSDQSVPYYYAELQASPVVPQDFNTSTPKNNQQSKLNNLREINGIRRAVVGPSGIAHIHNPIAQQSNIQRIDQGRSISAEILNVADKDRLIDSKNLYESDSRIEKNVCKELSTAYAANKLYGKSEFIRGKDKNQLAQQSAINKLSLNYVENALYNNAAATTIGSRRTSQLSQQEDDANSNQSAGDIQWEEDAIWRESLRRVSHRHARSLDCLDRLDTASPVSIKLKECAGEQNKTIERQTLRIPREVNNFTVQTSAMISPTANASTLIRKKQRRSEQTKPAISISQNFEENDVYVELTNKDSTPSSQSDLYERLREEDLPNSRKSIELNREIIRQWDSMSSGLMKSAAAGTAIGVGLNEKNDNHNEPQQTIKHVDDTSLVGGCTSNSTTSTTTTTATTHNSSKPYHIV